MKNKHKKEKIKIPFHPIIIPLFSIIFTFLVGGIVAGLNWTRLSKPNWKYPTIGCTVAAFIVFLIIYSQFSSYIVNFVVPVTYLIFGAVGFVFYLIQKPYYDLWKEGKI